MAFKTLATIWQFKTRRFRVVMTAEEEDDWDLSWDESGEVSSGLNNGLYVGFCAACRVYLDDHEITVDYLGQCIYDSYESFKAESGYFQDMVREACRHAREHVRAADPLPYIREAA